MAKFDNSMFKSLTCGVVFDKKKIKRKQVDVKKEEKSEKSIQQFDSIEEDEPKVSTVESGPPKKKKKLSDAYIKCKNAEQINKLRKELNINVKGCLEPIKPIQSFDELFESASLHPQLIENIKSYNFAAPTPVQMQVLPIFLQQKSVKVVAPTGSGKTIAFAVPLIQIIHEKVQKSPKLSDQIHAIVLVPTRELALQILTVTAKLCYETGIRAHIIKDTSENKMENFHKKKTNILITTPLKLVHFGKSAAMTLDHVDWIVIDEVDKLFEESNQGFKDDLDSVLKSCKNKNKKFALFSATTTKEMTPFVHENLKDFVTVNISPNLPTTSVKQELLFVGTESAKLMTIRNIINEGILPPVLIFLQSKDRAKQLHSELKFDGLRVDVIHSDRSQKEREEVHKSFREGKIWVLICTELMSRGIDFRDVNMVINFDLPTSIYSYIHRVGRCGRANRTGKAITFYTSDDKKGILRDIAQLVKKSGSHVEGFLLQLKKSTRKERIAMLKKAPKRKNFSTKIESDSKPKSWKKKLRMKKKLKKMQKPNESGDSGDSDQS